MKPSLASGTGTAPRRRRAVVAGLLLLLLPAVFLASWAERYENRQCTDCRFTSLRTVKGFFIGDRPLVVIADVTRTWDTGTRRFCYPDGHEHVWTLACADIVRPWGVDTTRREIPYSTLARVIEWPNGAAALQRLIDQGAVSMADVREAVRADSFEVTRPRDKAYESEQRILKLLGY